jgi:hypothetical protein
MQVTFMHCYGAEAMKKSSVLGRHKWFKLGRENVEDYDKSRVRSHSRDENVEKMRNFVHSGRHLNIRAMAVQLNLDRNKL